MRPPFLLSTDDVALPRGSRVVLTRAAVDRDGVTHRPGILATVKEADGDTYTVETPGGTVLVVDRATLTLQRHDLLASLAERQWDERRLRERIVYAAVVGSQAWGLASEKSDEDVRGCFVLPFEEHASLYDAPDEIHDDERQIACWEIEKLVRQALRADPNTLELLWSPLHEVMTPLGQRLVDERAIFSSMRVLGSFGRYAQSQLTKLARAAERARHTTLLLDEVAAGRVRDLTGAELLLPDEDVHALVRSLFDRGLLRASSFHALVEAVDAIGPARLAPEEVRPKNAYNLVRLLHSCLHWLTHGEPLIRVEGELREELLAIKEERTPLEQILARAHEVARQVELTAPGARSLPEEPDVEAADRLLRDARRLAARSALALPPPPAGEASGITGPPPRADLFTLRFFPRPLPGDVDTASLRRFLTARLDGRACLVVGLTGAHAYGFPSPDSDLDLKAVHAAPASAFLGLGPAPAPLEVLEVFEGREMDLSSHELGQAAQLLLKGNGNMLERLLGPLPVVLTPLGERLADLARRTLSRRVVHHYRGFLHAMKRESDIEARDGKRTAKRLLYAYRVACTGAHLLLEGVLVTDVRSLAPLYGFAERVEELVVRKRSGEHVVLDEDEARAYLEDLPRLEALLDDAFARTSLPAEPREVDALEALLVEARLALVR